MSWIADDRKLTLAERENNADIIIAYYRSINYDDRTIASIVGNMDLESDLSPVRNEMKGSGYGLVQWSPKSKLINHCRILGLSPYTSGDVQLKVVDKELGSPNVNEWYTTSTFINNYISSGATSSMIGVTASEFKLNSKNFSLDDLTVLFMAGYLRPDYNPSDNHIVLRKALTKMWYAYMGGVVPPTPPSPPTPPTPPTPPPRPPEPPSDEKSRRTARRGIIFKKKRYLQ